MQKWAYPLLIAFVAFFIFSNPAQSGTQGRAFVIWVGELAGAVGEFMDGLFDDEADPSNNDSLLPGSNGGDTNGGAAPAEPDTSSGDTFSSN